MKDKIFMILLGTIAVNLTIQTVKDVGTFPTAYAQDDVQKVAICRLDFPDNCVGVLLSTGRSGRLLENNYFLNTNPVIRTPRIVPCGPMT